ncbi:uncharacterized protein LOC122850802 [Aphidius gifuensis]|uniref:uncharacterized protein LOC122850802 n=1 Tax=Aphidius gifuensis TaxID=684658 RepID=UPI001CDD8CFE|nr:uncharacterized protein LOC122850802 [Aphidius gifuensis]
MSAKRIFVEKDQQTSDDDDKDQKVVINSLDYDSLAQIFMMLPVPERIDIEGVCVKWKEACQLSWYNTKKYKCESSIGRSYRNRLLIQSYLKKILLRCEICSRSFYNDPLSFPSALDEISKLQYLEHLKLCIEKYLEDSTIIAIANNCKNLKSLEIRGSSAITETALVALTKLKNLQKLDVSFLDITDSFIDKLKGLKELHCDHCKKLTEAGVIQLIKNNPDLKDISVWVCVKWKEACQLAWYDTKKYKCESSIGRSYDNHVCNSHIMPFVGEYCKNLTSLECEFNENTLVHRAHHFVEAFTQLDKLKSLTITVDSYYYYETVNLCKIINSLPEEINELHVRSQPLIVEEAITAISNNCKKLIRLEIFSGSIYNDPPSSPSVLDKISRLQYLEHLKLCMGKYLKDSTIIAIANNCKNLKSLEIAGCSAITETALVALTKLNNLQKLDVSFLDITDSFISKLKGLKELHCKGCTELADDGIIELIKNNPDLKEIDVSLS